MKLPWNTGELEQKVEELEQRLEDEKEEKNRWKNRFEAEEERRKELSRKKQEAEEKLNRLKDRQEKGSDTSQKEEKRHKGFETLDYESTRGLLDKLSTIESVKGELVSIYSPRELEDHSDLRDIKNSVTKQQYSKIQGEKGVVAFIDDDLGSFILKLAPFYNENFAVGKSFDINSLNKFFESEKYFVLVSAGETYVYREENGDYEELKSLKSRINREHGKGGFSQGRFERKRDEQIDKHINEVEEFLEGLDGEIYLRGERNLCKQLPGKFIGGFDPNRPILGKLYGTARMK